MTGSKLVVDKPNGGSGVIAGCDLGGEPAVGLRELPHAGIERPFWDVAIGRSFLVRHIQFGSVSLARLLRYLH